MEETLIVGIAFRGYQDSVPHRRDSIPRHRDNVPPPLGKSAPIQVTSDANRSLPSFYLFLPANIPKTLWIICRAMRGAPLRGSPTFGGSPSHITTSRLCGLSHWAVHPGQRYTNRSAASRLRPLCTVCAYGLPGAKG